MLNLFKHLLPKSEVWKLTIDRRLRQLYEGIVPSFESAVEFFDLIFWDLFPQTTRHLAQWEAQFGLDVNSAFLLEQDRRDNLEALWKATGGQSPRYIQDTLRNAGFDVYVYDWWRIILSLPVERDKTLVYYWLVNKLYTALIDYNVTCGEAGAECGEAGAECGENNGVIFERTEYPWPPILPVHSESEYVMYIGGSTWGSEAVVPIDRRDEFEDLCLKICPQHLWIGMFVRYGGYVIEDDSGDYLLEDGTSLYLLE